MTVVLLSECQREIKNPYIISGCMKTWKKKHFFKLGKIGQKMGYLRSSSLKYSSLSPLKTNKPKEIKPLALIRQYF